MKRQLLSTASILMLMACQDGTNPESTAPLAPGSSELADVSADAVTHLFAVVDQNGGLTSGNGVTGVVKLGPGQYEVTFSSNMSQCAYQTTTANIYSQAVQSYPAGGHLSANGVYVETKNQGGGLTDGAFNLITSCGTTGLPYAVIGYAADLARASAGVTLSYLGAGRYDVTFPTSVAGCGYIATVADPGNGLVFSPSGVYPSSGSSANIVHIETKNPGGGLQDAVPFHLTVFCPGIQKSRFAVVRANGTTARAWSSATTATLPSTGQYRITTNRSLVGCANVATRGSVSTALALQPATVEITPGINASSYGVQVRQLLFFGGALLNQGFHTASVCK
jgi:hypothetical protein